VQHIVILTQENRSFDHYFGTLRGVRGFSDPHALKLPSGKTVWHQPNGTSDELLPFRPPVDNLGLTFLPDPPHGWNDTHAAVNGGRMDQFVANKGVTAMTYHTRRDIPYHFALADAFTVCDAYHCSLLGPTDPNRYHLWTGWVGNDGTGGGPVITNAEAGYDWTSYPERLQRAGITWKVYQDTGDGLDAQDGHWWGWTADPYIGNYGDNALLYLHQYQNALPGTPLADRGKTGTRIKDLGRDPMRLMDIFRQDVMSGNLPQVSWLAAPEAFSEHPNFPADYGAWYISQVMDILTANPAVWSKTVFIVNYDEEGGFFDHMVPPMPPLTAEQGESTVPTTHEIYPGDASHPSAPYGLGMRVPMMVISPWSKGGWVNSQVFDHTSVIRFLEARFAKGNPDLIESNITPWRRAVAGDLTSCFDFSLQQNHVPTLPPTAAYMPVDKQRHDDYGVVAPAQDKMPHQERGLRLARPLPYALHARGELHADGAFGIHFQNKGAATAVFQVHSALPADAPRAYTVEPAKRLAGRWAVTSQASPTYDLTVRGPNGFVRAFKGHTGPDKARLDVRVDYDVAGESLVLRVRNLATTEAEVRVLDRYTREHVSARMVPGQEVRWPWKLDRLFGWYDLAVTVGGDSSFLVKLAGHLETGRPSASDPGLGGLRTKQEST